MAALTFLVGNWKLLGIGLFALILGVQTARLGHAKHDLVTARAALIDPSTKKPWQDEYVRDHADLGTCKANYSDAETALGVQGAAVAALKAEAAQRTANAAKAVQQAHTAQQAAAKPIATVQAAKPGPDVCSSARSILMGEHG